MAPMVSTTRRLDNGDGCRKLRRGYYARVGGGSTLEMMTIASNVYGSNTMLTMRIRNPRIIYGKEITKVII